MRYHEIIFEASDALLYHFAQPEDVPSILHQDSLGLYDKVSLTRDANHYIVHLSQVNKQPRVALLLDGRALGQRFAMEPRFGDIRAERRIGMFGFPPEPEAIAHGRESEEEVDGTIAPLSRYLREIVVDQRLLRLPLWTQLEQVLRNYGTTHKIPVSVASMTYGKAWLHKRKPL